jgi:adenylate cyclase
MKKAAPKFFQEHLLPAAVFFACAYALTWLGLLERLEFVAIDAQTRLRANLSPKPMPAQLVVMGVGEQSLKKFGRWPWNRNIHGDFVRLNAAAEAKVMTWDILFTEPAKSEKALSDDSQSITTSVLEALSQMVGDKPAETSANGAASEKVKAAVAAALEGQAGDANFAAGIRAAKESDSKTTVILAANFGEKAKQREDPDVGIRPTDAEARTSTLKSLDKIEGDRTRILSDELMLLPAGELGRTAEIGFATTPPGTDGIRRWVPLMVRVGDSVYPTLSLQSLLRFWDATPDQVIVRLGDAVRIETPQGRQSIPIDERGRFLVNYRHLMTGFKNHDYYRAWDNLFRHYGNGEEAIKPPDLKGKIVLIGQVADGLSDLGPSPLAALTPLVLTHANVIENVLAGDFARQAPVAPVWFGVFALGVLGLAVFSRRKLREQAIFSLGVPVIYAGAAYLFWSHWSLWLPLVGPLLGFFSLQVFEVGRRVIAEQKAKQEIKGMFGTYVSPALVSKMIDSGTPPQLGGHDDEITAYFSDIQSFSTFSEKLGSGPLVELMNEYLTACTDIVQEQGGTLDKYIGDAIVAMFGAPIPLPDHAYRACVATQLVHQKLGELRAKWKAQGDKWPQIVWNMQTRIGLNSGVCMIGNMGSRTRFNYTMMGDNVNLAARMESGAKSWGAYTMVAEATKLACEKHGGDRVVFRQLGRIVVKGRSSAVPIHEIVGLKESVTPQTLECIGLFEQGLAKHYARDWDGAIALFHQSSRIEPNIPGQTPGVASNPSLVYIGITEHYKEAPPSENWDGVYHMKEK